MSDLPDIDTSEVSYLAYWNAIDQGGVDSISPTDVTSNNNVVSYTAYDNGVEGTYNAGVRNFTFRVKSDGWMVAYLDQTEEYGEEYAVDGGAPSDGTVYNASRFKGPWNVLRNVLTPHNQPNFNPQNTLERAINSLRTELSNAGKTSYSSSDVGLFGYHTDATNSTALWNYGNGANQTVTLSFQYTSETTLHDATWLGRLYADTDDFNSEAIKFDGTEEFGRDNTNSVDYIRARDLWGDGNYVIDQSGYEYVWDMVSSSSYSIDPDKNMAVIVEWS